MTKIAIPTNGGRLSTHFGHCEKFAIVEADKDKSEIVGTKYIDPPKHEPGALPKWLREQGVGLVIAAGMGNRAQQMFAKFGVESMVGAPEGTPEEIVKSYLAGGLETGDNICDH